MEQIPLAIAAPPSGLASRPFIADMSYRQKNIVGLRKFWRGLQRLSRRQGDAAPTRMLFTLRGWLWRRLQQFKARSEARARLDLELLLHAQAMREALREAEEKVRVEIALRIRAEQKARQEAEARLEIERVARREAERRIAWIRGPVCPADPETIAKAHREMMSRVEAEQLAMADVHTRSVQFS